MENVVRQLAHSASVAILRVFAFAFVSILVTSGCSKLTNSKSSAQSSDRILNVDLPDSGDLTMEGEKIKIDDLVAKVRAGLEQKRWDEIHLSWGKASGAVHEPAKAILHYLASEYEVKLKEVPSLGYNPSLFSQQPPSVPTTVSPNSLPWSEPPSAVPPPKSTDGIGVPESIRFPDPASSLNSPPASSSNSNGSE